MKQLYGVILFIFFSVGTLIAQPSQLRINGDSGLDKEIAVLMNDLDLSTDQKIMVGMLIMKQTLDFDYQKFNKASETGQYLILKKELRQMEGELKGILDKKQYKVYKKSKKALRKELKKQWERW